MNLIDGWGASIEPIEKKMFNSNKINAYDVSNRQYQIHIKDYTNTPTHKRTHTSPFD